MATVPEALPSGSVLLLGQARNGSPEAVEQLLGSCREYLLYLANREMSPELRAKVAPSDLVQESLLKAHQGFGAFEGKTEGELFAWLRQILIRKYLDAERKYRDAECRALGREEGGQRESPLCGTDSSPSSMLVAHEDAQAIRAAIDRLPEEYRQAILLRTWEGRSFGEVGTILNRSAEAARKLWFRAVEMLKEDWLESNGSSGRR